MCVQAGGAVQSPHWQATSGKTKQKEDKDVNLKEDERPLTLHNWATGEGCQLDSPSTATSRCRPVFAVFLCRSGSCTFFILEPTNKKTLAWKARDTVGNHFLWQQEQESLQVSTSFQMMESRLKVGSYWVLNSLLSVFDNDRHHLHFSVPAARVCFNISIANCSHSLSTLKKGRLWAQAFSPITAVVPLIPQLRAMWKFHPPTGLIPTTQHCYSNLIPKGAFDLRAYGTRSFWNVPLVSSRGLCTAETLYLLSFCGVGKGRHATSSGNRKSHLPLNSPFLHVVPDEEQSTQSDTAKVHTPTATRKRKSLDEFSDRDVALRRWVWGWL